MDARKNVDEKVIQGAGDKRREREATTFEKLCQLARNMDAAGFKSLHYDHYQATRKDLSFNFVPHADRFHQDKRTVMMIMAEEKNHDAVNFLADEFDVSLKRAVEGFARVGEVEKVNGYLEDNNFRNEAARGYAYAGNAEQVNKLARRGIDLKHAAYGYGRGGHLEHAKKLYDGAKHHDKVATSALEGFGHSGHIQCAESFILHAAGGEPSYKNDAQKFFANLGKKSNTFSKLCHAAMDAFAQAGFLKNQEKFLRLLATTENASVRNGYIDFAEGDRHRKRQVEKACDMSIDGMVNEAARIREVMLAQECDFDAARVFKPVEVKEETAEEESDVVVVVKKEKQEEDGKENKAEEQHGEVDTVTADGDKKNAPEEKAEAKLEKTRGKKLFGGLFGKKKDKEEAEVAAVVEADKEQQSTLRQSQ